MFIIGCCMHLVMHLFQLKMWSILNWFVLNFCTKLVSDVLLDPMFLDFGSFGYCPARCWCDAKEPAQWCFGFWIGSQLVVKAQKFWLWAASCCKYWTGPFYLMLMILKCLGKICHVLKFFTWLYHITVYPLHSFICLLWSVYCEMVSCQNAKSVIFLSCPLYF